MRYEAIRQCDAVQEGRVRALFPGQVYDLDPAAAADLIASGAIRAIGVEARMVAEPPRDKAIEPPQRKARRT